ncbi:STAS domain-containing protein [Oscillochloris sp. ZM17-4]|uniref:STAS domain-containing protein n=1 Tax=Oscillochloris sp. ZM17-4 TaxID=2866714 RepID=UPI001C739F88|nr:STAS domain-containing protein [Oscillochloris sp. ZM17-4]MBX0329868.1 STAS domain-containing protein [Oscillochloris sp. ZM17-4]
MKVSQRQVVLALLGILIVGTLLALLYQLVVPDTLLTIIGMIVGLPVLIGLLIAYWRGWGQARYATLIVITVLIGLTTDGVFLTDQFNTAAFLPPVLALIVAGPLWVVGSALGLLVMLIIRAGGQGIYAEPVAILLYAMSVGGMLLARMVTNTAQLEAEESADLARQALSRSEAQAHELSQKAQELEAQNAQQRQLFDLVNTLETPAVSLADGVLLAPIVGHLDSRRAGDLTRRLLNDVSTQGAHLVILDIAGVQTVDTAVAQSLLRAIQAVRLLGCEVTVTGISASVAATMTQLGINMAGVRTARTPQEVMGSDLLAAPRPART